MSTIVNWRYDLSSTAQALGLKKSGSEYKGPCPLCGGHDRCWVRAGKTQRIIISCRQGCSAAELLKECGARGLIDKDTAFQYASHNQQDCMNAQLMVMMVETQTLNGKLVSEADKASLRNYIGRVPPSISANIHRVLREAKNV